jgi:hypothetical protein
MIYFARFSTIDQQECASMSFANTHPSGKKAGQFQPLIASPTYTLNASPSVGSIHLTTLPNKGAADSKVNSTSNAKLAKKCQVLPKSKRLSNVQKLPM